MLMLIKMLLLFKTSATTFHRAALKTGAGFRVAVSNQTTRLIAAGTVATAVRADDALSGSVYCAAAALYSAIVGIAAVKD
mmetsp:Transcript_17285/g.30694  ORF Transcript_17285/g.30694 Transcript_17285/m.30694 type:complete len:80 (-) Transcript_17285:388-627(-)